MSDITKKLTKLFSLDQTASFKAAVSIDNLINEITITGLPAAFDAKELPKLIVHDLRERGQQPPAILYFPKGENDNTLSLLLLFKEPLDQTLLSTSVMDCVDDALTGMKLQNDCPYYGMTFENGNSYNEAIEFLKRSYPDAPRPPI